MADSPNAEMDLASFRDDLAALKRDVASLIEHVKGGATDKVHEAAEQIDRGARGLCHEAEAEGERSAKAIGAWVEKQPVLALLIALGVGYVGARVLLR
jgi:hypothetical protein